MRPVCGAAPWPSLNTVALADTLIAEGICAEVTPDLAEGYAGMLTPKSA